MYLIECYVTNSSLNINHPFTYVSDVEIDLFKRINVSFNRSDNVALVTACAYTDKNSNELKEEFGFELLPVLSVIDEESVISIEQYELAKWLSRTTISPLISCLNAMLPKVLKTSKTYTKPKTVRKIRRICADNIKTPKQKEIYEKIYDGMKVSELDSLSISIRNKLIDCGAIEIYEEEYEYTNDLIPESSFKTLNKEQEAAYKGVINTDKLVSLLFGVTGSGKTEVYLHLARYYLSLNRNVLILVPEISLTPQMIERVKERFEDVVFYHSELNDQERYEQYKRVKNNEVKIVVGTRSSIFLPFNDLGLIIIDEEHDQSYYQDSTPVYNVKNVAIKRAIDFKGKVLLASATPSLESYSRALKGDYQFLELKNRINQSFPDITLIDLNKELRNRHSYIISKPLKEELDNVLSNNKQALILLNRRGYSPVIKCADCGDVLMCQDCDIALSYHNDENVLKCHQCGRKYAVPKRCPNCNSSNLIYYGFGTKKVEEELIKLYPDKRIIRMDRDAVGHKGAHQKILKAFGDKEYDILVGTQMISKGLDFPDVTLVGILNGDAGLMHQDYNSSKTTFDFLMQASGRSGRSDSKGKVFIQVFNPEHYAIKAVEYQDYTYFYNIEMKYREKTKYPPYSHLLEIVLSDTNDNRLEDSVNKLYDRIDMLPYRKYKPYSLNKLNKLKRYRIVLLDKDLLAMLKDVSGIVDEYLKLRNKSTITVKVDSNYLD
ncbi:MAG: primosomal protein N' [Erysipelotrichaceae bacterium]|nr:primosomal protein N' [Erysipelotrichaceae bacterium]